MTSVCFALVLAAALGLAFETTRWMGVLAAVLLCVLVPQVVVALLALAAIAFLFFNHWR